MASAVLAAAVSVLFVLPLAVVGLRRPAGLLALYGVVVPLGSSIVVPLLPDAFGTLSSAVGLAIAVVLVIHLAATRRRTATIASPLPAWVLLFGVAVVTLVWSVDLAASVRDVAVLASLVAAYAVASFLAMDRRGLALVDAGIVAGGGIAGAIALWQLATGSLTTQSGIPRFTLAGGGGEVGDPNITAATLLLPLAVGLTGAVTRRRRGARIAFTVGVGLTATGLLLTGSRGGLLSVMALLGVLALNHRRQRLAVTAVLLPVVALAIGLTVAPAAIRERLVESDSTGRTEIWRIGLSACEDYCLVGSGWGTFPAVHAETLLKHPRANGRLLGFEAHNIWLQALVEAGLLGLLLLTLGLTLTVRDLLWLPPAARGTPLAALAAVLVANLFLSTFDFKYFWLVLIYAALTAAAYTAESDHDTRLRRTGELPTRGAVR